MLNLLCFAKKREKGLFYCFESQPWLLTDRQERHVWQGFLVSKSLLFACAFLCFHPSHWEDWVKTLEEKCGSSVLHDGVSSLLCSFMNQSIYAFATVVEICLVKLHKIDDEGLPNLALNCGIIGLSNFFSLHSESSQRICCDFLLSRPRVEWMKHVFHDDVKRFLSLLSFIGINHTDVSSKTSWNSWKLIRWALISSRRYISWSAIKRGLKGTK
jgi:hypothetical protein